MAKSRLPDLPWMTPDGFLDMKALPLDYNFRAAVGEGRRAAFDSLGVLQMATCHGRKDASVFLMGLLVSLPPGDWEMRLAAVEALRDTRTERCAFLLFSEIRRVKSSNTTRRYLDKILEVLASFPAALVRAELEALAEERTFSPKMRAKFRAQAGLDDLW